MPRTSRFVLIFIVICLILLASGCGLVPKGIQEIFISATPTATNTPTNTPTPTATATPTITPLPPIFLYPCTYIDDCPEAVPIEDLLGHAASPAQMYHLNIPYNQTVQVIVGYIAIDEATLKRNLAHIQWIYTIDGKDYFQEQWLTGGVVPDEKNPSIEYPGMWLGVNMQGWQLGQSHVIRIGFRLAEDVNDGWSNLEKGYAYVLNFNITPINPPTATPTATITPKPRPTTIPFTKTPSCSVDSSIEIENTTGGYVILNLSGPAKFKFNIPTGTTTWNVCSGSYSYTAYGCGGASDTGAINSGESHKFYCVTN